MVETNVRCHYFQCDPHREHIRADRPDVTGLIVVLRAHTRIKLFCVPADVGHRQHRAYPHLLSPAFRLESFAAAGGNIVGHYFKHGGHPPLLLWMMVHLSTTDSDSLFQAHGSLVDDWNDVESISTIIRTIRAQHLVRFKADIS